MLKTLFFLVLFSLDTLLALSDFGLLFVKLGPFLDTLQLVFDFDFFFNKQYPCILLRFYFLLIPFMDTLLTQARNDLKKAAISLFICDLIIGVSFEPELNTIVFCSELELEESMELTELKELEELEELEKLEEPSLATPVANLLLLTMAEITSSLDSRVFVVIIRPFFSKLGSTKREKLKESLLATSANSPPLFTLAENTFSDGSRVLLIIIKPSFFGLASTKREEPKEPLFIPSFLGGLSSSTI